MLVCSTPVRFEQMYKFEISAFIEREDEIGKRLKFIFLNFKDEKSKKIFYNIFKIKEHNILKMIVD